MSLFIPAKGMEPKVAETVDGPPDEPGEEMSREARVWKTYVREADQSDKEMVTGRTSGLDVLLVFAALFSAIATAFIIESAKDLKPDYAESSAKTQIYITKMLAAIANGEPVPPPMEEEEFSPSLVAVAVNFLWFLSLSLSLVISLIAMLSKDWCYKFMSGRSGQTYEQAQLRQQKWNGIERWRMTEGMDYMPAGMHLALFLFGVGMCLNLWQINVAISMMLIAVTGVYATAYVVVTFLPWCDPMCPYSTPLTDIIITILRIICLWPRLTLDSWPARLVRRVRPRLPLGRPSRRLERRDGNNNTTDDKPMPDDYSVPMDKTTSQILAWLITNCEDSRSVNAALRAIASASRNLPDKPLVGCGVLDMIRTRMDASLRSKHTLPNAVQYYRAYGVLTSQGTRGGYGRSWSKGYYDDTNHNEGEDTIEGYLDHCQSYIDYARQVSRADFSTTDHHARAAVAITLIPICHWDARHTKLEESHRHNAIKMATEVLRQHLRHETEMLSPSTLIALIQSTTHYLVWTRPSEKHHLGPYDVLPILLARIFFESHDNAQGVARAAAVALAAASFAAQEEYPSSEKPASSHNNDVAFAREKQAVELLNYYREHAPLDATTTALFVFGFFGLLNGLKFNDSKIQEAALPSNLKELMWRMPKLDFNRRLDIYSLQATYSLMENMYAPALVCMTSIAAGKPSDSGALAVYKCLPLLIHHPSGPQQHPNPELYTLALTAFCRTESAELQELCLAIIDAQSIPANPLCLPDFQNTLEQLCGRLVDSQTTVAPIAALHVGLLVAALIANDDIPVKGRLEALQPLTSLRGKLDKRLSATNPLSKSVLFDRLKQGPVNQLSTSDIMLSTTQSIFDFLEKGLAGDTPSESAESLNNRLKDLRDSFKPDTVQVGYPVQTRQGSSMFVYGPSSPAAAPAQVAQGVQYMPPV